MIGERIWNMERQFNNARRLHCQGRRPAAAAADRAGQDRTGQGPGQASCDKMLPEYYEARGWDSEGVLKADTRERLGL